MAKVKFILVNESEQELKLLLRKQPVHLKNRIQMLMVLKMSEVLLSKDALSKILKINHSTTQKCRTFYSRNGLEGLFLDSRIGFKPTEINTELHQQ